jgi:hypothetical protein
LFVLTAAGILPLALITGVGLFLLAAQLDRGRADGGHLADPRP